MCLDAQPTKEEIEEYAALFEGTSIKLIAILGERFSGEQSTDFYKGMFAALEATRKINKNSNPITAGVYEEALHELVAKTILAKE